MIKQRADDATLVTIYLFIEWMSKLKGNLWWIFLCTRRKLLLLFYCLRDRLNAKYISLTPEEAVVPWKPPHYCECGLGCTPSRRLSHSQHSPRREQEHLGWCNGKPPDYIQIGADILVQTQWCNGKPPDCIQIGADIMAQCQTTRLHPYQRRYDSLCTMNICPKGRLCTK